jgi:nucleoside diphosphate kinase
MTRVAEWDAQVFCVIAPDAVRRQLVGPILDRFAATGLRPAGWRLAELTSRQIDTMHELAMARSSQAYRFRCLDLLFGLGPSVLVRLADAEPHRGDPYARAHAAKGASDPRDAEPGSIRHDLGAINVVMSLLHTSDSPADAATEVGLLLDGIVPADRWRDPVELPELLAVLTVQAPERRMFGDVLAGVRARVISRLWAVLGDEARAIAGRLAAGRELGADHAGEKIALAAQAADDPLLAVLATRFDTPIDLRTTERVLAGYGIGLDDWEAAVLGTSMYFPPVR